MRICCLPHVLVIVLSTCSSVLGGDDLSFPDEGRWSVATGWRDQWPADWHHAKPERQETIGEWTIHYGSIDLPSGTIKLQDNQRTRSDGITEVLRRWDWTAGEDLADVTLSVRTQIDVDDSRQNHCAK